MTERCILIGNGTSLMDKPQGAQIDSHDCVVRFNAFDLKGYEQHAGGKCDVWYTVSTVAQAKWRMNLPWKSIWVHNWTAEGAPDPTYEDYLQAESGVITKKVSHNLLKEMSGFMETKFRFWSTGMIAVWNQLKIYPSVTLAGFDWWEREAHHYNDRAQRGTLHKPKLEREFIARLEAQKRVNFL
jgi:hypothetical protein